MTKKEIHKRFLFLGEGLSRRVYAIDDNYIVKVGKGREGFYQNKVERYVYYNCGDYLRKYINPIIWSASDMLIMPRAKLLSDVTRAKYIDLTSIRPEPDAYRDILYLTNKFYLFYEDIISVTSWGIVNGIPVLIDYGCTSEEGDRFYD
jgi:hypothetical protein